MIKALQLLELKTHGCNITDRNFADIMNIFEVEDITLYQMKKFLSRHIPIKSRPVSMCTNSCIAFTSNFSDLTECPICQQPRFYSSEKKQGQSRKVASYFSLIERLKIQFQNEERIKLMLYRSTYQATSGIYKDIFDGTLYQQHLSNNFFSNFRDIALTGSIDGYQIFRQKRDDCWVIMFINCNLPPQIRVKKQNLLIGAIIPGPKTPKNMNSFLVPIIDELKKLEGML